MAGVAPPAGPPTGTPPPIAFSPGQYPAPTYRPAYPPVRPPSVLGGADRAALGDVRVAAILGLVGVILSYVSLTITPALSEFTGATTTSSGSSFTLDITGLYVLIISGSLGLILVLIEIWYYRSAFKALASYDRSFSTPAGLAMLAFVAILLVAAFLVGFLALLYQAYLCAGSGGMITAACINAVDILGLALGLGIAAILALVGYIGLLIGIWRLGTRYNDSKFKAGAILIIIPFLNIVGLILILIAAHSAREKLGPSAPPVLQFG